MTLSKRSSTIFLRIVVVALGLIVLALCIFALPSIWKGGSEEFPGASNALLIIVVSMYLSAVPFFIGLWQTLKLLNYIDKNKAFSDLSINALRNIKYCASIIGVLCLIDVPLLVPIAEADDAPGLIVIGAVLSLAPFVVSVFAAVLERLLQNAIDIKKENELTV